MMRFTTTGLTVGFALLVDGMAPQLPKPGLKHWDNITFTTTTTSEATIYTAPANSTIEAPYIGIYNLEAVVCDDNMHAYYSFEFAIEPNLNAMYCNASVPAADGNLDNVKVARCWQPDEWLHLNNYTMPAQFSFAWQSSSNGSVLVLRSTNPGSADACPYFPHDACWAQGLYWVPEKYMEKENGTQRYIGPGFVVLNGTYCKTGMGECSWSEYLY